MKSQRLVGLANDSFTKEKLTLRQELKWSFLLHLFFFLPVLLKSFLFSHSPRTSLHTLKVNLVSLPSLSRDSKEVQKSIAQSTNTTSVATTAPSSSHSKYSKASNSTLPSLKSPSTASISRTGKKTILSEKNKQILKKFNSFFQSQTQVPSQNSSSSLSKDQNASEVSSSSSSSSSFPHLGDNYYYLIRSQIQENWTLPPYLMNKKYFARVQVYLNAQGHILKIKWIQSSGNVHFDKKVNQALEKSSPFSPPPSKLQDSLLKEGILIGFPL